MYLPVHAITVQLLLLTTYTQCAQLEKVPSFGANPSNLSMHIYIPDRMVSNPPILLAMHMCGGNGPDFFRRTRKTVTTADRKGFILIYPTTVNDGKCWDVGTRESLTRGGASDTASLVNMIKYALSKNKGNPKRVFMMGESSGAMMTNALAAVYPDVFAAGSVFSGVGPGCMATDSLSPKDKWSLCCGGKLEKTGAAWAKQIRSYYPDYSGTYPRMQIWHGTADKVLRYQVFGETMKAWSETMGQSFLKNRTNDPQEGYTKLLYGDGTQLVGYSVAGVGHSVPLREDAMLEWFGL